MNLLSVANLSRLAFIVPCVAAMAGMAPSPALAISAPDARAVCRAAGGIINAQSENAAACNKGGVGNYQVVIGNNVNGCTFVATLGAPGDATPPAGEVSVALGGNNNRVRVQTRNSAGVLADRPFHLVVAC